MHNSRGTIIIDVAGSIRCRGDDYCRVLFFSFVLRKIRSETTPAPKKCYNNRHLTVDWSKSCRKSAPAEHKRKETANQYPATTWAAQKPLNKKWQRRQMQLRFSSRRAAHACILFWLAGLTRGHAAGRSKTGGEVGLVYLVLARLENSTVARRRQLASTYLASWGGLTPTMRAGVGPFYYLTVLLCYVGWLAAVHTVAFCRADDKSNNVCTRLLL